MRKRSALGIIVVVMAGLALVATRVSSRSSLHRESRFLMDTFCTIQAYGAGEDVGAAISKAFDRMEQIDREFNCLHPASPLYLFNNENTPVTHRQILEVIQLAQQVSQQSGGALDITLYPLEKLWGFYGDDTPALPEEEQIDECLRRIGYENIVLKNGELEKLNQDVCVDLGAIAKGFAIKEACRVLREEGITSALVDAGGDIGTIGKIKGKGWGIGIRDPRNEGNIGVVQVSDLAVVTSGDYERFFIEDGIRYCHILNPRTGYPARKLISTTVIYPDPVLADAWATALFVMGPQEGMRVVEQMPGMETVMVTADGEILCSSGLEKGLTIIER